MNSETKRLEEIAQVSEECYAVFQDMYLTGNMTSQEFENYVEMMLKECSSYSVH